MAITVKDVALAAGTSTAAVSAALNGNTKGTVRVSQATKDRITEVARSLGYAPNPIAQSLSTGRSGVIGLTFPYADAFVDSNPFCSQVMNGVFTEAIKDQFNMMLYTGNGDTWSRGDRIDPRVDGLILVLPSVDDPLMARCLEQKFPFVAVVAERQGENMITVNADDFAGGQLGTSHLISLGHRKIAILLGTDDVPTNRPRFQGYLDAMAEHGLEVTPDLVVHAGFDWEPAYRAMKSILAGQKSSWPTAVFAINDLCAAGAMRAIKEAGASVPGDIAIVGFDDTWFAAATRPSLTSVRMPIREMGALAVQLLISEISGTAVEDRGPVLPVSLTVRATCGARKGADSSHDVLDDLSLHRGIL